MRGLGCVGTCALLVRYSVAGVGCLTYTSCLTSSLLTSYRARQATLWRRQCNQPPFSTPVATNHSRRRRQEHRPEKLTVSRRARALLRNWVGLGGSF